MDTPTPRRTLIVANLTASTPILLQELKRRATERPTKFTLLIPGSRSGDWSLETAVKLMEKATDSPVEGRLGGPDPFESVKEALADGSFDEVMISTLPKRTSEWLRKDLPTRVEELGVPVSVITPPEEPSPIKAFTEQFDARVSRGTGE
jgi:hypothetical protein